MSLSSDEINQVLPFGARARLYLALASRRGTWITYGELHDLTGLTPSSIESTLSRMRFLPNLQRAKQSRMVNDREQVVNMVRLAPLLEGPN